MSRLGFDSVSDLTSITLGITGLVVTVEAVPWDCSGTVDLSLAVILVDSVAITIDQ